MLMGKLSVLLLFIFSSFQSIAQDFIAPQQPVGKVVDDIKLDGSFNELSWQQAPVLTNLKTTVPIEGGTPTGITEVRILARHCYDWYFLGFGNCCKPVTCN